ncbi:hypothetical protein NDN08_001005 [Rhodosorus marinus]|uniref:FAD-binding PCMH-type domain-containing protein n=1 Tax=Rhodosorus marinus TaxID=101924 RepID=A0AAV8UT75_9RHOD|nr:hypothetical protein NDN08_001005 [Rhodosorus marinus]
MDSEFVGADVDELKRLIRGKILFRSDAEEYFEATECFNHDSRASPFVIVQVLGARDVQLALNFARGRHLSVSVAGGRHMFNNASMSGDLVVDMRLMRSINVDPKEKTAWVEAGAIVFDLDQEAVTHDLAGVTGQYYDTGVAGFTLGGGVGYLSPKHGLSVDNLLAVEVVTPSGEHLYIDDKTDPEKMWVARGAGWNLGVVLRLKLKLHTLEIFQKDEKKVHGHAGLVMWALTGETVDPIVSILEKYLQMVDSEKLPVETQPLFAFGNPPPFGGAPVLLMQHVWVGNPADGEAFLKEFTDILPPTVDTCDALDWIGIQAVHTPMFPKGHRYYLSMRAANEEALFRPGTVRTLTETALEEKPKEALIVLLASGKACTEVPIGRTACTSLRESRITCLAGCHVEDKVENSDAYEKAKIWVRETLVGGVVPIFKPSVYTNLDNVNFKEESKQSAYADTAKERIATIKSELDPTNLFKFTKVR